MKDTIDYTMLPPVFPRGFLKDRVENLRKNGLPEGLKTGLKAVDDIFRLDEGRLITVTGVPGSGKSEFVDFLASKYNREFGMRTLYFSPENMPVELHIEKLLRKYFCKSIKLLSAEDYETGLTYILNNFFFMNAGQYRTMSDIIKATEEMVEKHGVKIVVIDPLNCVEFERTGAELETQYISRMLDDLAWLARRLEIMVFIVAHPKKMESKGDSRGVTKYEIPNAYDINGSAHFFNKSDFIIVVHRENLSQTKTIVKVDKVKFANYGRPGKCNIGYDVASGNYYDLLGEFDDDGDNDPYLQVPFTFPIVEERPEKDPLNVEVSYYPSVSKSDSSQTVILKDFLFSQECKEIASRVRAEKTPEARKAIKKGELKYQIPGVTVSGKFSSRNNTGIISQTGLICIDVDWDKNSADVMASVPDVLHNHPSIIYASKSISGDSFYAIIKLENPEHFTQHYLALEKEFKDDYGITLDPACKDICRLRFGSYDENPYYNPSATTYYKEYLGDCDCAPAKTTSAQPFEQTVSDDSVNRLDSLIARAHQVHATVADGYEEWQKLAMSIGTLGEDGRARYHAVVSLSHNYDKDESDKRYTYVLEKYADNNEYTLATAISILNEAIVQC